MKFYIAYMCSRNKFFLNAFVLFRVHPATRLVAPHPDIRQAGQVLLPHPLILHMLAFHQGNIPVDHIIYTFTLTVLTWCVEFSKINLSAVFLHIYSCVCVMDFCSILIRSLTPASSWLHTLLFFHLFPFLSSILFYPVCLCPTRSLFLCLSMAVLWAQPLVGMERRWVLKAPSSSSSFSVSALSPRPLSQNHPLHTLTQVTSLLQRGGVA